MRLTAGSVSARDRRALFVGTGVVAIAVLTLRVLPTAARTWRGYRDKTLAEATTLARAETTLVQAPALRDSVTRTVAAILAMAPALVDGRTPADAQASLQGLVTLAATRHRLKVLGFTPLPDSAAGVLGRVAVHVALEGDLAGVADFLATVETGPTLLSVPAVALEAPNPSPEAGSPEVLHVELDVAGLFLAR